MEVTEFRRPSSVSPVGGAARTAVAYLRASRVSVVPIEHVVPRVGIHRRPCGGSRAPHRHRARGWVSAPRPGLSARRGGIYRSSPKSRLCPIIPPGRRRRGHRPGHRRRVRGQEDEPRGHPAHRAPVHGRDVLRQVRRRGGIRGGRRRGRGSRDRRAGHQHRPRRRQASAVRRRHSRHHTKRIQVQAHRQRRRRRVRRGPRGSAGNRPAHTAPILSRGGGVQGRSLRPRRRRGGGAVRRGEREHVPGGGRGARPRAAREVRRHRADIRRHHARSRIHRGRIRLRE